jgi:S1-C subfamily serine protease
MSSLDFFGSMSHRRRVPKRLLCLLAVAHSAAHAESPGEEAFRAAIGWTVEVRTSVSEPFVEDEQGSWIGAGLLVDPVRGWILTNAHVAGHSYGRVAIAFKDGRAVPARRIYVDPYLDLAVLAFDPKRLPPNTSAPTLDCESIPPVGHPVGAFGHPWGFRFTGTRGITSAVTTRLGANMLQTDAPINEGNSGGPLISLETGHVVGINTAKIKQESVEGLSFAVPMPYACTIIDLLTQGEDPSPPDRLVNFATDENDEQVMIVARTRLPPGTLDLRAGDRIVGLESPTRAVETETDLVDALRGRLEAVSLSVMRDDKQIDVRGRWPPAAAVTARRGAWISGALIAEAEPLTNGLIVGTPALMVHYVSPGSDAEAAGLMLYDLILSADGSAADSAAALLKLAHADRAAGRPMDLMLLRLASEAQGVLFSHQRRLLPVEDAELVGP